MKLVRSKGKLTMYTITKIDEHTEVMSPVFGIKELEVKIHVDVDQAQLDIAELKEVNDERTIKDQW